jgi:hypothetical protein
MPTSKPKRTENWYLGSPTIISEFVQEAKKAGYKVSDCIETIILTHPENSFKIMLSRISGVIQCYYTGCGWNCSETLLSDFMEVNDIWIHVRIEMSALSTEKKDLRGTRWPVNF